MGTAIDIAKGLTPAPKDEAGKQGLILAKDKALGTRLGHITEGAEYRARRGSGGIKCRIVGDKPGHGWGLSRGFPW